MKKILISIRPEWVAKILSGEKTIEVRKTAPKCELPCEVYIYCTKGDGCITSGYTPSGKTYPYFPKGHSSFSGKVVAKFTLNKVEEIENDRLWETDKYFLERTCLSFGELACYLSSKIGYAWHIDNLVIFGKPKTIWQTRLFSRFKKAKDVGSYSLLQSTQISKAPQSWCYVEVDE